MASIGNALFTAVRSSGLRVGKFMHGRVFGYKNLLITNALISAAMGTLGDFIQQEYDILKEDCIKNSADIKNDSTGSKESKFCFTRSMHMTAAGLTTGITTHYWYILLDRFMGVRKTPIILAKKILLDQIVFSPVNLFVYFTTVGICERSSIRHIKAELVEKGMENIYVAEWLIWPPAQLINFAILPLRYRILFDNVISLGFDIYSPYVKYKTSLKEDQLPKQISQNSDAHKS